MTDLVYGQMTGVIFYPAWPLHRPQDLQAGTVCLPGRVRLDPPPLTAQRVPGRVQDLVKYPVRLLQPGLHALPFHAAGEVDAMQLEPLEATRAELFAACESEEGARKVPPHVV